MKHLTIYILFAVTAMLVLLNRFTGVHINDYRVHFGMLFIAAATFTIIVGHFFKRLKSDKSMIITALLVGLLCFAKAFLTWGGDWKTQTILYRNCDNANRTIALQMRGDRFAFGYKRRMIEIRQLVPFIDWTTDIDTFKMNRSKWRKINLQVNELGLPADK